MSLDSQTPPTWVSMFERIGGAPIVMLIVNRLYQLIGDDPQLAPLFDDVDISRVRRHMTALLAQLLGGPSQGTGPDLAAVHQPLRITGEQYARVGNYLLACLHIEHAPADIVATVANALTALRLDIVNHQPATAAAERPR